MLQHTVGADVLARDVAGLVVEPLEDALGGPLGAQEGDRDAACLDGEALVTRVGGACGGVCVRCVAVVWVC